MSEFNDNIIAIAALNKVAEIRQLGLEEDYKYLVDSALVQKINSQAKAATGVDLLDKNNILTFTDIDKYESFLEKVVENSLPKKYSESFLADEIALLNIAREYPVNDFRGLNITIESLSPFSKRVFKFLGITMPTALSIIKNSYRVDYLDVRQGNFFTISKLTLKSKDYLLFSQISVGQTNFIRGRPKTITTALSEIEGEVGADVNVLICILFNANSTFANSPTNMFLQILTRYGKDITIDYVTKKFFLEGYTSNLLIRQGDEILFSDGFHKNTAGSMYVEKTPTGTKYGMLYGLDFEMFTNDFRNKRLL
jgi:hypothetical protein